jgi:hypothetical protein
MAFGLKLETKPGSPGPLGRVMKAAFKGLVLVGVVAAVANPKTWAAEKLGCTEHMLEALLAGDVEIKLGNWPFAPSKGEEVEIGDGSHLWVGQPYTLIFVEDGVATHIVRGVIETITSTSQPGVVDLVIKDMSGFRNQSYQQKGIWGWDPRRTENSGAERRKEASQLGGFRIQDSGFRVWPFILAPAGRYQIQDFRFQSGWVSGF